MPGLVLKNQWGLSSLGQDLVAPVCAEPPDCEVVAVLLFSTQFPRADNY